MCVCVCVCVCVHVVGGFVHSKCIVPVLKSFDLAILPLAMYLFTICCHI